MDALEGLQQLDDNTIDLYIVDPPYYKIMLQEYSGTKHEWDNQWNSFEEYLQWIYKVSEECYRTLKNNGSFYIFGDDKHVAYMQVELDKLGWALLNHIIWWKFTYLTNKGWKSYRCYSPTTEHILFYGFPENADGYEGIKIHLYSSLRDYLIQEKDKVGLTLSQTNQLTNTIDMAGRHYFSKTMWCLPTREKYVRMQLTFNAVYNGITIEEASKKTNEELQAFLDNKQFIVLRRDYMELRQEYEALKNEYEKLRRTFNIDKNYTDVWRMDHIDHSNEFYHPTQKPLKVIKRIIKVSSNKGDLIVDPFIGSGTTALACMELQRNFIGFENKQEYVDLANERINDLKPQTKLTLFDYQVAVANDQ